MNATWLDYTLSTEGTHHLLNGKPAYTQRFLEVQKFHEPGLAPARDSTGAYHITSDGLPAYLSRFVETYGFYDGKAAVQTHRGWCHILPDGSPLHSEMYAWCGNFQEGRCPVRLNDGSYFHTTDDGSPAYSERYSYAGDFRDGIAVVQRSDGKHTHIDASGNLVHSRWFLDLDVFHKGHARACDSNGWHHVDTRGVQLYESRFRSVEPFYNGQSRVERFDGSLSTINHSGNTTLELRKPTHSPLEELSGEMVGLWRTQTIRAAVELGVFEPLPATAEQIESRCHLAADTGNRLLHALMEMGLVSRDEGDLYHPTDRGSYLSRKHPLSLADAALHWGRESYAAWSDVVHALRTGQPGFESAFGKNFFEWVGERPGDLRSYHNAMATYAKHDYRDLAEAVNFTGHQSILDAGGGTGELTFALLRSCPGLFGVVMDRPEVTSTAKVPEDLDGRCTFVGADLFEKWPISSETIVLARVLHDWSDSDALRILKRARESMCADNILYVVEMVKDDTTGSGSLLDLHMLVTTGGAERTEAQFRYMLDSSGFRVLDVIPTESVSSVIRAVAV